MKLIPLSKGKAYAQVDDEDYDELMKWKWSVVTGPGKNKKVQYAKRSMLVGGGRGIGRGKRVQIYMHKVLLPPPEGMLVDHKDRNGLNNQRSNLRLATYRQNSCNCSRPNQMYRGVFKDKSRNPPYHAGVKINRKKKFLGYFETEEEAARAYDSLALHYHGEFAVLNFPEETPKPLTEYPKASVGESNVRAKLTEDQVKQIKLNLAKDCSISAKKIIAAHFNVSVACITDIHKQRRWKHLITGVINGKKEE